MPEYSTEVTPRHHIALIPEGEAQSWVFNAALMMFDAFLYMAPESWRADDPTLHPEPRGGCSIVGSAIDSQGTSAVGAWLRTDRKIAFSSLGYMLHTSLIPYWFVEPFPGMVIAGGGYEGNGDGHVDVFQRTLIYGSTGWKPIINNWQIQSIAPSIADPFPNGIDSLDKTAKFFFPYYVSTSSPEESFNQTAERMDALLGCSIESAALTAPPGGESEGEMWLVKATATGAWVGEELNIALFINSGWTFIKPTFGMYLWNKATSEFLVLQKTDWKKVKFA